MKDFVKSFAVSFIVTAMAAVFFVIDVIGFVTLPRGIVPWVIAASFAYAAIHNYRKSKKRLREIESQYRSQVDELRAEMIVLKAKRNYDDVHLRLAGAKLALLSDTQRYIVEDLLHHGESERKDIARRQKMGVNEIHSELCSIFEKTQLVVRSNVLATQVIWKVNPEFVDVLKDELKPPEAIRDC
jgi:hypothetical protein